MVLAILYFGEFDGGKQIFRGHLAARNKWPFRTNSFVHYFRNTFQFACLKVFKKIIFRIKAMCDSENNDFPKYLINRTPSRRRYTYIGGAGLPDLKHPVYQISQNWRNLYDTRL